LASTEREPSALLGRHVVRRPDDRAGRGLGQAAGVGQELGDAEVEELHPLAGDHLGIRDQEDVVGLEVAVDDAGAMGGAQRGRDLPRHHQRRVQGQASDPGQPGRQRLALEQLHHDVGRAVGATSRSRRSRRCSGA
jgi:hypothetical protein